MRLCTVLLPINVLSYRSGIANSNHSTSSSNITDLFLKHLMMLCTWHTQFKWWQIMDLNQAAIIAWQPPLNKKAMLIFFRARWRIRTDSVYLCIKYFSIWVHFTQPMLLLSSPLRLRSVVIKSKLSNHKNQARVSYTWTPTGDAEWDSGPWAASCAKLCRKLCKARQKIVQSR